MSWILKVIPLPFLLLAAGLAAIAATGALVFFEQEKAAAREAGLPATIAISEVGEVKGFPWYDEVSVAVQMHEDLTYYYWAESDQGTIEYPIFFFIDPNHSGPVEQVLGAIAFDSFDQEAMVAYIEKARTGTGDIGGLFEMAGVRPILPAVTSDEIKWAADDLGLTMSENFLYLDPYFEGRDTRIAARPELSYITAGAAVLLIWLSMIAAIIRRRFRRRAEANSMNGLVRKGILAAAASGAGMLMDDDEEGSFI